MVRTRATPPPSDSTPHDDDVDAIYARLLEHPVWRRIWEELQRSREEEPDEQEDMA